MPQQLRFNGQVRMAGLECVKDVHPEQRVTRSLVWAGEEECESQARAAQGNSLEYEYGWEWPTKAQWEAGQRYGLCWVPA